MNKVHFSSNNTEWETPDSFFNVYKDMYNIVLDVCATKENTKCSAFFDKKINGLKADWSLSKELKGSCWMNPPYGRGIEDWVKKAYNEAVNNKVTTVALLPARTDTNWFHKYIKTPFNNGNVDITFLKGRIRFKNAKSNAPFPSMVVVFRPLNIFQRILKIISI